MDEFSLSGSKGVDYCWLCFFLTMAQKIKKNIRHLLFETVTGGDFDDSLDIGWHKHYAETI